MRHIRLTLQYDGTNYSGWQIQKDAKTIQQIMEDAVSSVAGEHSKVMGAARTDAGVHAIAQVASFKTHSELTPDIFKKALNVNLPYDIKVIEASECSLDFHPRYDAKGKTYFYVIAKSYSVFLKNFSWHIPYRLDCNLMRQAAEFLTGEHNFSCFRASGCSSKHPVRRISEIKIEEMPLIDFMTFNLPVPVIKINITANAFLRHMARNIVGVLIEIGRGKILPSKMIEILESKDRRASGPAAPARGLFLEKVIYQP